MKKILSLITLLLISIIGYSQFVGLTNAEFTKLKALIHNNADVNKMFATFEMAANKALHEEPNPRDTIVSEGHLEGDKNKTASLLALHDVDKIYALIVTYKLKNQDAYIRKAAQFLKAWATTNIPTGNPINETKYESALDAYDMIRGDLPTGDQKLIDAWLVKIGDAEIANPKMTEGKKTSYNNWNSHRLKIVGQVGFILNEKKYKEYAENGIKVQIEKNLLPDGSGIDFLERDALHYHVYTLEPLLTLSIILKRGTGNDYYHYVSSKNSSIKKSVEWLLPYLTNEKVHPEYVNSKVQFDIARAKNNEKGFQIGAPFVSQKGFSVLALSIYFEPSYLGLLRNLTKTKNEYPDWQSIVSILKQ